MQAVRRIEVFCPYCNTLLGYLYTQHDRELFSSRARLDKKGGILVVDCPKCQKSVSLEYLVVFINAYMREDK